MDAHEPGRRRAQQPRPAHAAARCPIVVSYGETETDEFKRQSDDFLRDWLALGYPGRYIPMPGTNHYDIVLTLNEPASALTQAIFALMGLAPPPTPSIR